MTVDAPLDLHQLGRDLIGQAQSEHSGRAARTLPHPVDGLRQTVIALKAGAELGEHESPGAASLLVVHGAVRLLGRRPERRAAHPPVQPRPRPAAQPDGRRGLRRPAQRRGAGAVQG